MCGIIGYVGERKVLPILLDGLRRLEYRGYDSAGVALVCNGTMELRRSAGKLSKLEDVIAEHPIEGLYGIGHTRWATHGRPTEENAHPHRDCTGKIVVVHNGIIENYLELKKELQEQGHAFVTETDTEIVAHLVEREVARERSGATGSPRATEPGGVQGPPPEIKDGLESAVRRALSRLRGHFALVLISSDDPEKIVAVRSGPPVVVGVGDNEYFVASDIPAILAHTRDVVFLGDQEMVVVTRKGPLFTNFAGTVLDRPTQRITWDPVMAEKAGYKHFMLKEIYEQPWAVKETIVGRVSSEAGEVYLDELGLDANALGSVERVVLLACGTSWHAALVAKFLIEDLARLPVEVDYGSEYRYRNPIVGPDTLAIVITQSGETADTLAALREAKTKGARTIAICNVVGSMATREAEGTVYTHAGPEIGVASTKAFTTQLVALHLLALHIGRIRGAVDKATASAHIDAISQLPRLLEQTLKAESLIEEIARRYYQRTDFLYLGRGINYPIALEGALKLKEISYIHAEGYPAGEMKHGPIALIDEKMPVVAIAPGDSVFDKMLGNIQEAKARGGSVLAITTAGKAEHFESVLDKANDFLITLPESMASLFPVLAVVPLQLLAYHIAVRRGCDVDQPRNLAKSVTVE
ncbi:MAG: glutamine--fructose-6-phosphate transaminase (isomerizing) [Vicinamibacterales bacterium]